MRIGAPGAEKPVARIDDETYVDLAPPGVGMGLTPPVYLQPGDVIELGIDRLGSRRQHALGPR